MAESHNIYNFVGAKLHIERAEGKGEGKGARKVARKGAREREMAQQAKCWHSGVYAICLQARYSRHNQ